MNGSYKNLIGRKYGYLTVIEKTSQRTHKEIVWKCHCDCGKETLVIAGNLRSGRTRSCGCYESKNRDRFIEKNIVHGCAGKDTKTVEYKTWASMIQRCTNQKNKYFKDYGGRGIKICQEWLYSFENFLAYLKANGMYPRPVGMSIDRFPNNDGNYEPGNIRWATSLQQRQNQRPRKRAA
jgi:hypothetical protein